jgi:hypothetical protein
LKERKQYSRLYVQQSRWLECRMAVQPSALPPVMLSGLMAIKKASKQDVSLAGWPDSLP